jgi:hypothetical protein
MDLDNPSSEKSSDSLRGENELGGLYAEEPLFDRDDDEEASSTTHGRLNETSIASKHLN